MLKGKKLTCHFMKFDFSQRRWYEWIYIVLGVFGIIAQLALALKLLPGKFNWLNLLVSFAFLWFGTVPRKPKS